MVLRGKKVSLARTRGENGAVYEGDHCQRGRRRKAGTVRSPPNFVLMGEGRSKSSSRGTPGVEGWGGELMGV